MTVTPLRTFAIGGSDAAPSAAAVSIAVPSGRHDPAARRRSKRAGRERGCWLYVPAEYLAECGIDPRGAPPRYRVWPGRKRTLLVQLYEGTT
jgi:hypothetical protein